MASLMDILRQAGFSGSALNMAYAIAMAESGGNARAFNGNSRTGDQSYGLFQINMIGGMGPERRRLYGLSSNEALFDALTNARVAYKMSNGGRNWSPWSVYKSGSYRKFLGQSGASVSGAGGTRATQPATAGASKIEEAFQPPAASIVDSPGASFAPGGSFAPASPDFSPGSPSMQMQPKAPITPAVAAPAKTSTTTKAYSGNATDFRDRVIAAAMGVLGTPYSWGGGTTKGPSLGFGRGAGIRGFDCSSLVMYAFAQAGFNMPRTGRPQLARGRRVSISQLRPGDLVGWGDGYHVAIYLGGGKIIESPRTGLRVRIRSLSRGESVWGVRLTLPGD